MSTAHSRIKDRRIRSAKCPYRRGMQLLEMVVALSISATLLAGISASVYLAQQSMQKASAELKAVSQNEHGLQRFQQDISESKQITDRTATSLTVITADRNGDGQDESIRYRWNEVSGPLERSLDGTNWTALTGTLTKTSVQWNSAAPAIVEANPNLDPSPGLVYRGMTQSSNTNQGNSLLLASPSGWKASDVCLALIAVRGNANNMTGQSGWTKIVESKAGDGVTLGAWYTTSVGTVNSFTWSNKGEAIGCLVTFSGNNGTAPVAASVVDSGNNVRIAKDLTGTFLNHQELRVLAGIGNAAQANAPQVALHSGVWLKQIAIEDSSERLTLAIATRPTASSGTIGSATFGYAPSPSMAVTMTIALKP